VYSLISIRSFAIDGPLANPLAIPSIDTSLADAEIPWRAATMLERILLFFEMFSTRHSLAALSLFLGGICLYLTGAVFTPIFYGSLRERVLDRVLLSAEGGSPQGSTTSRFLVSTDTLEVYLHDIINVEDVRGSGAVPALSRRGPYVFSRRTEKVDVAWSEDGRMISYRDSVTYEFLANASSGTLDDRVTTVNVPLVGVLEVIMDRYRGGGMSARALQYVAGLVEKWRGGGVIDGVFMHRSVRELLGGYTDGLLEVLGRFGVAGIDSSFGLLVGGVDEGQSAQWTGLGDVDSVGEMHAWRGMRVVEGWGADMDPPEVVHGTRGRQFAPGVPVKLRDVGRGGDVGARDADGGGDESGEGGARSVGRTVWVGDAYRAFGLRAVRGVEAAEIQSADGPSVMVDVEMLTAGSEAFEASSRYQQKYRGLLNITGPVNRGKAGVPLFLSLPGFCGTYIKAHRLVQSLARPEALTQSLAPHLACFLGVDAAEVVDSVKGAPCPCEGDDDDGCIERFIRLDMEPLTGMVVQARKALMLSTQIGPRYRVVDSSLARNAFVPIMEVEERGVGLSRELHDARRLQHAVGMCVWVARYLPWVSWVVIVAGVVMIALSSTNREVETNEQPDDLAYDLLPGDETN
jgi:hypothetical protein